MLLQSRKEYLNLNLHRGRHAIKYCMFVDNKDTKREVLITELGYDNDIKDLELVIQSNLFKHALSSGQIQPVDIKIPVVDGEESIQLQFLFDSNFASLKATKSGRFWFTYEVHEKL